jgi:hypothetical protein
VAHREQKAGKEMSYTLKPNPPCKDCEDRHAKCHAKCPEYIEWNEARQKERVDAYKRKCLENEADDYSFTQLFKNVERKKRRSYK